MHRGYSALGIVAFLYQLAGSIIVTLSIIAIAVTVFTIVQSFSSPYQSSIYAPVGLAALIPLFASVLAGIGLYAFGELINLFRDMEFNSRVSAHYTELNEKNSEKMVKLLEQLVERRRMQQPTPSANYPLTPPSQSQAPDAPRWGQ